MNKVNIGWIAIHKLHGHIRTGSYNAGAKVYDSLKRAKAAVHHSDDYEFKEVFYEV